MMNAVLGSILGGVVAGAVALVATAQGRAPDPVASAELAPPYAESVGNAPVTQLSPSSMQVSTPVRCVAPDQPVLQRSIVQGVEVAQVTCVRGFVSPASHASPLPNYARVASQPPIYGPSPEPEIVERTVVRPAVVRRTARSAVQRESVEPRRSWKKTALVIGGAAGAGAGVGALAGGKKGALIGAAIGGGSGAIYEAAKRR